MEDSGDKGSVPLRKDGIQPIPFFIISTHSRCRPVLVIKNLDPSASSEMLLMPLSESLRNPWSIMFYKVMGSPHDVI